MNDPESVHSLPFGDKPILDVSGPWSTMTLVPTQPGEQPFLECSPAFSRILQPLISREGDAVHVRFQLPSGERWARWTAQELEGGRFPPLAFMDLGAKVQLTLHLPAQVKGKIHLDAGRIRAQGLKGCELELETGAGALALKDVDGRLKLRAGAGKITGENLSGSLEVEANAGSVRLGIGRLATGRHWVHSSMGSVRLTLAPNQKVQVDARAAMGSVRNAYPSAPGAETVLEALTEFGSVRIDSGEAGGEAEERGDPGWAWQWPGGWGGMRHRWWGHGPWNGPGTWRAGRPGAEPEPPAPEGPTVTDEEMRRILTLVSEGKLTPEEAQKLLRAMESGKR